MPTETPVSPDDPRKIAWDAYKATPEYANSRKWALHGVPNDENRWLHESYVDGSLWAAFIAGFHACAELPR